MSEIVNNSSLIGKNILEQIKNKETDQSSFGERKLKDVFDSHSIDFFAYICQNETKLYIRDWQVEHNDRGRNEYYSRPQLRFELSRVFVEGK